MRIEYESNEFQSCILDLLTPGDLFILKAAADARAPPGIYMLTDIGVGDRRGHRTVVNQASGAVLRFPDKAVVYPVTTNGTVAVSPLRKHTTFGDSE